MGRRKRTNLVPDIQQEDELTSRQENKVLDDLVSNAVNEIKKIMKPAKKSSDDVETREDLKKNEYNIISKFSPGDKVKLKTDIKFDMVGRRIHNGIHNYVYTVRLQRDDGLVIIDCLAVMLTVKPEDIIRINL